MHSISYRSLLFQSSTENKKTEVVGHSVDDDCGDQGKDNCFAHSLKLFFCSTVVLRYKYYDQL